MKKNILFEKLLHFRVLIFIAFLFSSTLVNAQFTCSPPDGGRFFDIFKTKYGYYQLQLSWKRPGMLRENVQNVPENKPLIYILGSGAITVSGLLTASGYEHCGPSSSAIENLSTGKITQSNFSSSIEFNPTEIGLYKVSCTDNFGKIQLIGHDCGRTMSVYVYICVSCDIPTPIPSVQAADATCTSITAHWGASTDATKYFLSVFQKKSFLGIPYRSYVSNYKTLNIGNITSKEILSLSPGTDYYYEVVAASACGSSAVSRETHVKTLSPSAVPVTTIAGASGCNSITVNWNTALGASSYLLQVADNANFNRNIPLIFNSNVGNITSKTITGLLPNKTYYYRVASDKGCGVLSAFSAAPYLYSSILQPLSAPLIADGTNKSCTSITANWNPVEGALSYEIDVRVNGDFLPDYTGKNVGNVTSLIITGLSPGTTYRYRVRAINLCDIASANSLNRAYSTLSKIIPPAPVSRLVSNISCNTATVNWFNVTTSAGYLLNVFMSDGSPVPGYIDLDVGKVASYIIEHLNPGTTYYYNLKRKGACNNSIASANQTFSTSPLPISPGPISGNQNICSGQKGQLYSVPSITGFQYNWTVPAGIGIVSGATSNSILVDFSSAILPGSYNISVFGSNNCGAGHSSVLALTVNPLPLITVSPDVNIIIGDLTTLAASGAGTYLWSPPENLNTNIGPTVDASPLITTLYDVIGISAAGCTQSALVKVTVHDPCKFVKSDQNPIVRLNSPDNFAMVNRNSSLNWSLHNVPSLHPPLTDDHYILHFKIANEITDPATGLLVPDWTNAIGFSNSYTSLNPDYSEQISKYIPSTSNIPRVYYWKAGLQYELPDKEHQKIIWSSINKFFLSPDVPVISSEKHLTDNVLHTNNINWVYGISYLDEGKISEGIAYIDGLGKSRQVQSKLNTENKIMAVEAAYSEEGGGSVLSLPAPLSENAFGYAHHFFDVNIAGASNRDFSTEDFDQEVLSALGSSGILKSPAPVNSEEGSVGAYYSSANADANVDDAQGYPYSYNVGYKSPLQRPMFSSAGVGSIFKITGGKEYRHFYGFPSQQELNRIFGATKAPVYTNINRNITFDPNGIGNITYKDNEGKIIATALTSCNANSLVPLEEDGMKDLTVHLNPLGNRNSDVTTLVNSAGSKFFIPCSSPLVTFKYELELNSFKVDGLPCMDCKFNIGLTIVNENTGETVLNYNQAIIPGSNVCAGNTEKINIPIPAQTLQGPANYVINRTVKPFIDPVSGEDLITSAINTYSSSLQSNKQSLLEEFKKEFYTDSAFYILRQTYTGIDADAFIPPVDCYEVSTLSGSGEECDKDGHLNDAQYFHPSGIAKDPFGNFYIADLGNNVIRKIDKTGVVYDFAGNGCQGQGFINGNGDQARFNSPGDLVYCASADDPFGGAIYVADEGNNAIRKISLSGDVTTFAQNILINAPEGLAADKYGNIYVANAGNGKVLKIDQLGEIFSLGTFSQPSDVVTDDAGNVYVCEKQGNTIQKIDINGNVSTIAGSGIAGDNDAIGTAASFNTPVSIGIDKDANLYVSDAGNNKVRKINGLNLQVTTIAGIHSPGFADGGGVSAKFNSPAGLLIDNSGNAFLADKNNNRIRSLKRVVCADVVNPCVTPYIPQMYPTLTPSNPALTPFIPQMGDFSSCKGYLWYIDKVDVVPHLVDLGGISGANLGDLGGVHLVDLDGDQNADGIAGDEKYNLSGISHVGAADNDIRREFAKAYKRMHWYDPTGKIISMEVYSVEGDELDPNTIAVIGDKKELIANDHKQYYLLNVKLTKPGCEEQCMPNDFKWPCDDQCNQQKQSYEAEKNSAYAKLSDSKNTFSDGSGNFTIKELVDKYHHLNNNLVGKLTEQNDIDLYLDYENKLDVFETFKVEFCMNLCNGVKPGPCKTCQPNYEACVFENMDLLNQGYDYFINKWDNNIILGVPKFPYTLDNLKPLSDPQNINSIRVADPDELNSLGQYLFDFLLKNLNNINITTRENWNAQGGTCVNCQASLSGSPACEAMPKRDVSSFPGILLPVLEIANEHCVTEYSGCLQLNGDAASQKSYFCSQDKLNCIAGGGTEAECDAIFKNCTGLTSTDPPTSTTMDDARSLMIRNVLYALYPDPAKASTVDALEATIKNETAALSIMELEDYLFNYIEEQKCILDCHANFDFAFQTWLDEKVNTFATSVKTKYLNSCVGSMNEALDISYKQSLYHYTLYNYDAGNNLVSTIPPEGIDYIDIESDDPAERERIPEHRMASKYKSNSLFTLSVFSPDEGETRYLYDKAGRVRFSQNAEQKARGADLHYLIFSYTKYDAEARIAEAGEYKDLNHEICGWSSTECQTLDCLCPGGKYLLSSKADQQSFPNLSSNTFEETYIAYDTKSLPYNVLGTMYSQTFLEGRVSKTYNCEGATHYSYDAHGRVKFAVQEISALSTMHSPPFGGAGGGNVQSANTERSAFKTIDYLYTSLTSQVTQIIYQRGNSQEEFHQKYTYDEDNRLTKTEVSRDGLTWLEASQYQYYTHGPLKKTILGNDIQNINLTYNINGWLKSINKPIGNGQLASGLDGGSFEKSVFSEVINYFKGDFTRQGLDLDANSAGSPASGTQLFDKAPDLFNGNISSTITNTAFNITDAKATPNIMAQGYRYDYLNRLKDTYAEVQAENFVNFKSSGQGDDAYSMHMNYDANGNVMEMTRNSMNSGIMMDHLTYKKGALVNDHYSHPKKQKNRTEFLEDAAGDMEGVADIKQYSSTYDPNNTSTHNFEYDEKGRLKTDKARDIENIEYTAYDKIKKVHHTAASTKPDVEFTYNSKQERLTKKTIHLGTPNADVTTIYSYDASGILMATYDYSNDGSGFKYKISEQEIYGLSRIGNYKVDEILLNNPAAPGNDAVNLRFELSDHRGDVRAVIGGTKDANNNPEIYSLTDKDPWGFTFQKRNFQIENARFGYQGSERDPELLDGTFYTTDFRGLDAARGEWWIPDPVTQAGSSPYASMDNNPVALNDPMGLSAGYNGVNAGGGSDFGTNGAGGGDVGNQPTGNIGAAAAANISNQFEEKNIAGATNIISTANPIINQQFNIKAPANTNFQIKEEDLSAIFPNGNIEILKSTATFLNEYMEDYGIKNDDILAHFLAQVGTETGGLVKFNVSENLNYSLKNINNIFPKYFAPNTKLDPKDYVGNAEKLSNVVYGDRFDNNGDGYKYRGRGMMQLTGKCNYKSFTEFYQKKYFTDCDFVVNPDFISESIELSVLTALWFFKTKVVDIQSDYCKWSITKVSNLINGGNNGIVERKQYYKAALKYFRKEASKNQLE